MAVIRSGLPVFVVRVVGARSRDMLRWCGVGWSGGMVFLAATDREAYEEVGVIIDPVDLRVVHAADVVESGPEPRLGVSFMPSAGLLNRPTSSRRSVLRCNGFRSTRCRSSM